MAEVGSLINWSADQITPAQARTIVAAIVRVRTVKVPDGCSRELWNALQSCATRLERVDASRLTESLIADLLDPKKSDARWANATSLAAVVPRLDPEGNRDQLVRAGERLADALDQASNSGDSWATADAIKAIAARTFGIEIPGQAKAA